MFVAFDEILFPRDTTSTCWTWWGCSPDPVQVTRLANVAGVGVSAVAASDALTVVLKSDGTVWTFGANNLGQLGHTGASTFNSIPGQVPISGVTRTLRGRREE